MTHLYLFCTIYTLDNIMDSAGHAVTLAKSTYLYTYILWMVDWIYILYDISMSLVMLDKTINR